jgi:bifunctional pyridoxal-dependent enzyme with beta-cystathionase and maltose regulon repressor activities
MPNPHITVREPDAEVRIFLVSKEIVLEEWFSFNILLNRSSVTLKKGFPWGKSGQKGIILDLN